MPNAKLVLVLVGAALALAGCGSDDESSPTTGTDTTTATATTDTTTAETTTETPPPPPPPAVETITVVVENAAPKGGIVRATFDQGDRVVLLVTSDVSDEVHLHGYDLSRDVAQGQRARIAFVANVPGRFEVELENRAVQIAQLTVEP